MNITVSDCDKLRVGARFILQKYNKLLKLANFANFNNFKMTEL